MFGYVKNILRTRSLKDASMRAKKRRICAYNFETAKTVGIIYPFNINMGAVQNALNDIKRKYDVETVLAVYFPQEKLPEGIETGSSSQIFFSDNECNWFGNPKATNITEFVNTEFDILIDLSARIWFPLQYIAIASHAGFKIGRINGETNNPYSFVLLGSESEEQFIKDLEKYLYKIK
jgi:hypothetical protein